MCVHLFSCTVIFDISYLPIHGKCGVFDLKDIGDSLEDLFTSFFVDFKGFRLILHSQHYPIRIGIVNAPNDDPVISRCFVILRAGSFSGLLSDCSSVVIEEEQYECDVEVWSRYRCFNLLLVILNSLNYSVAESHSKIPLVCTHVDIKKAICNVEAI